MLPNNLILTLFVADGTCISNPCWNYVQGIDNTKAIIFDLFPGTGINSLNLLPRRLCLPWTRLRLALNISVENIDIHPQNLASNATTVICDPSALAPGEQSTLGFLCKTGPYVTTEIKPSSSGASRMMAERKEAILLGSILALALGLLF